MDPERPEFRISDADRQEALTALGEHVRTGRLDIDEYGDRSAQVTTAKTLGELAKLFLDLPRPRPAVLDQPARREPGEDPSNRDPSNRDPSNRDPSNRDRSNRDPSDMHRRGSRQPAEAAQGSAGAWLASAAIPISAVLAIVLFFTVARGMFLVFLIPVAVALLVSAATGRGWPGG